MKKINLFLMVMAVITLGACEKDKDSGENFSKASPEEHKRALQEDAVRVAEKIENLQNHKAIIVMEEFVELMNETSQPSFAVDQTLKSAVALKKGGSPSLVPGYEDDLFPFGDLFNGETGIYTYNEVYGEWQYAPSDSELTYKFVSAADEDVVFSITDLKSTSSALTEAKASLTVDGKTLMTITFSAAYDNDGNPTLLEQTLMIDEYILSFKSVSEQTYTALDYSFTFSNENILAAHFDSKGNFDLDEFDNVDPDMNPEDLLFGDDLFDSANIWIALGNLKFDGFANWKGLNEQLANAESAQDEEGMTKAMASALNNNVKLFLRYYDNDQIIAKSEFYASEKNEYGTSYWQPDMRMKFADGTSVSESFIQESLSAYFVVLGGLFDNTDE